MTHFIIIRHCIVLTRWRPLSAGGEGVSLVSLGAAADGVVAHHVAPGVDAAHAHAGVGALEVDAGQAGRTLAVDNTLWPAAGGSTDVSWTQRKCHNVSLLSKVLSLLPGRHVHTGLVPDT